MKAGKNTRLFGGVLLLMLVNTFWVQELFTDHLYYQTYSGQLSTEVIAKMLHIKYRFAWLSYVFVFVLLVGKLFLTTCCFWIGSFFAGAKNKFRTFWSGVLIAEFVFVFFSFLKTGLLYIHNFETLTEIGQFQPLTLLSLFDPSSIPGYFHYPLSLLSVPEVCYWLVLALQLRPVLSYSFFGSLWFVAKTYGVGLLIWVSVVVFFTLNILT
ncbi:MAG TPA: hypothetical protein PLK12_03365 [Prolixibacteraceae bacterium]|nr:hypothetical protein [Prolixibacteraceae bacterium]